MITLSIEVLVPIAPLAAAEARLTARPSSLAGKRLTLLTTEGKNSRELLEAIATRLRDRYGVVAIHHRSRHGGGEYDDTGDGHVPARAGPIDALARDTDLVIAGVGL